MTAPTAAHPRCTSCLWYSSLDDADRTFFDHHAATDRFLTRLYKASVAAGLTISQRSFRYHLEFHTDFDRYG